MNLYALAVGANRRLWDKTVTNAAAVSVVAENEYEAIGRGIDAAKRKWSPNDGWVEHWAQCCLVPDEQIELVKGKKE